MSRSTPTRGVKCQVCLWTGSRRYGDGILSEPCPEGHRVTYAISCETDPPVTADTGEIRKPGKIKRKMTPEHKFKLMAARQASRGQR